MSACRTGRWAAKYGTVTEEQHLSDQLLVHVPFSCFFKLYETSRCVKTCRCTPIVLVTMSSWRNPMNVLRAGIYNVYRPKIFPLTNEIHQTIFETSSQLSKAMMLLICTSFIVFCFGPTLAAADLLGPRFPPPIDVASSKSLSAKAWQNLTKTFDEYLNGSFESPFFAGIENITFSLGAFSIHDPSAASALQYHYTDPLIQNNTVGVTKVDADSVYRFASVSKLFTAYAGMVSLTEEEWNRPFTKIFPILAESDGHAGLTQVAQWESVTPLSLASQISGVVGNAPPFGVADIALPYLEELKAGVKPSFDPTAKASTKSFSSNSGSDKSPNRIRSWYLLAFCW